MHFSLVGGLGVEANNKDHDNNNHNTNNNDVNHANNTYTYINPIGGLGVEAAPRGQRRPQRDPGGII